MGLELEFQAMLTIISVILRNSCGQEVVTTSQNRNWHLLPNTPIVSCNLRIKQALVQCRALCIA